MRRLLTALLLPTSFWLAAFLVLPAAMLAAAAVSSEGLRTFLMPETALLLGRSFRIAAVTTLLSLVLGYPLAYYIAGAPPARRGLLLFLVVLPFWTNLLVRTYAIMFLLRPAGLLYSETAVVFGLVHSYLPFMVLPLYASIEKVPGRLVEAARDLGARPSEAFLRVTMPLTMPGIVAGCVLVFIPVLGAFAIPELLGGARVPMIGSQVNLYFMRVHNEAAGA